MSQLAQLIPLIIVLVLFYVILIVPQRKKEKQLKEMIASLKLGDEVATIGGIHGKVFRIKDDTMVLESGVGVNKSYITVDRSAVARLVKEASNTKEVTPIPEAVETEVTEENED